MNQRKFEVLYGLVVGAAFILIAFAYPSLAFFFGPFGVVHLLIVAHAIGLKWS